MEKLKAYESAYPAFQEGDIKSKTVGGIPILDRRQGQVLNGPGGALTISTFDPETGQPVLVAPGGDDPLEVVLRYQNSWPLRALAVKAIDTPKGLTGEVYWWLVLAEIR
jgi:hypothetical protein